MRRATTLALLAAALAPATAAASAGDETLLLDAHHPRPDAQPTVTAATTLAAGHAYTVTVTGTYSIVPAERWLVPSVCGTPEPHPLLPSPDVHNGKVGLDPEVQFARTTERGCSGRYPRPHNRFQIDVGNGFRHVPAAGGPFDEAAPGHRYRYALTGRGERPRFRLFDTPATDNYGRLRIVIHDPAPSPAPPPAASAPPPPRRCLARRVLTIRLRRGMHVRRATVSLPGRRVHVRRHGGRTTVRIDLRRTRRARARVRLALTTPAGRRVVRARTYATCARLAAAAQDEIRTNSPNRQPTGDS